MRMRARIHKKLKEKRIAQERIRILIKKAEDVFTRNSSLANRYVTLARKIAMKANVRIPRELKRKYCKHCYKFLMPGVNCRIRVKDKKIVCYCFNCKKYMRWPFKDYETLLKSGKQFAEVRNKQ